MKCSFTYSCDSILFKFADNIAGATCPGYHSRFIENVK